MMASVPTTRAASSCNAIAALLVSLVMALSPEPVIVITVKVLSPEPFIVITVMVLSPEPLTFLAVNGAKP